MHLNKNCVFISQIDSIYVQNFSPNNSTYIVVWHLRQKEIDWRSIFTVVFKLFSFFFVLKLFYSSFYFSE